MNNIIELNKEKRKCSCCKVVMEENNFHEDSYWCETCANKYDLLATNLEGQGQLLHETDSELMLQAYELSTFLSSRLIPDYELYSFIVPKIYQTLVLQRYCPELYEEIIDCTGKD